MKTLFRKIMGSSFLVGMASIFCPTLIHVDYLEMPGETDAQSIEEDWKAVGSYILDAYGKTTKQK